MKRNGIVKKGGKEKYGVYHYVHTNKHTRKKGFQQQIMLKAYIGYIASENAIFIS